MNRPNGRGPAALVFCEGEDVLTLGALIAAAGGVGVAKWLGLLAVVLASINIFGGFAVTARMLAMYKKKERPAAAKH